MFQLQGNESLMVKWTNFSLKGSFWCHIPIIQPLVHITYFKQLRFYDNQIIHSQEQYKNFRKNELLKDVHSPEEAKVAFSFGHYNSKHLNAKKSLLATFLELKLLEAFLEAGPQFVFQLSVSSYNQIATIGTSAISLIWASAELYLRYPTEVHNTNKIFNFCVPLIK